jgi:hypothetical protein
MATKPTLEPRESPVPEPIRVHDDSAQAKLRATTEPVAKER